ncbi:acyl-CoA dehydrogenase family protein [Rhodococcus koreensis]
MKLTLESEHEELRALVRDIVANLSDSQQVRKIIESEDGFDSALWKSLAELGLLAITVPEELGGSGAGSVERAIVMEELGRGVVPGPYLSTAVLAADLLLASSEADQREFLPALASGDLVAAVAGLNDVGDAAPGVRAQQDGGEWKLEGTVPRVIGGINISTIFVLAKTDNGPEWFAVQADTDGVGLERLRTLDPTRSQIRIAFDGAHARRLDVVDPQTTASVIEDTARVALAAESLGGAERVLDMTVDYAKVRVQFGRRIGSYQAVKHGLADVYAALELARSVVRYAAWTADEAESELPLAAALAYSLVPETYFRAADAAIHFHGGIGFTAEHDAHLFYKRAKSTELLFGGASDRLALLADRLAM